MKRGNRSSPSSDIKVLFVAGFGPIGREKNLSSKLYSDILGIDFKREAGGYLHTDGLEGVKHFAVWPLSQAAESCFGSPRWPADIPSPQAWIEFDVQDIEGATEVMRKKGYKLLVAARKEPWGQVVTRMLSPEGLLLGLTYTPWMRKNRK